MKPSEAIELLKIAFVNKMQVLIKGPAGCGKSDVIDAAIAAVGADVITKHASTEDPTDARGLPAMSEDEHGMRVAQFFPFDDLAKMIHATKLTVVHLEDFGQASAAVQKAYMQLLLRRSINGHKLSPFVVFVGSTNDTKHMAGVEGILEPVKSRWHTIVELTPDLEDWVTWAVSHQMPAWLVAYVRSCPDILGEFKPTKDLTNSPSSRTVAAVGRWDNIGIHSMEVWAGSVGTGRAAEMVAFREGALNVPDANLCLRDPLHAPLPDKSMLSMFYATVMAIAYKTTPANFANAITYCARLGKSYEVLLVKDAMRRNSTLSISPAFAIWASDPVNQSITL